VTVAGSLADRDSAGCPAELDELTPNLTAVTMAVAAVAANSPAVTASAGVANNGEATTVANATAVISFFIMTSPLRTGVRILS
jgi:hypothetical protein